MARRRISPDEGIAALRAWAGGQASPAQVRTAVRYTLEEFTARAPGNSVELRVPPAGVTQVVEGPRHTRGTPPSTVEMDPATWLGLVTGRRQWRQEKVAGTLHASGTRADLSEYLPLRGLVTVLVNGNPSADGITSTS